MTRAASGLQADEGAERIAGAYAAPLRASGRYGRHVRLSETGKPAIDAAKVKAAERLDGKFVVHSNDDSLSAEDMALGYKQLQRVEEAWRRLKTGPRMRPVYHWAAHRIHAHVALTVLALLLERVAEHARDDSWRNIRDDLKQIKACAIVEPQRHCLAGHRTGSAGSQAAEIPTDPASATHPEAGLTA